VFVLGKTVDWRLVPHELEAEGLLLERVWELEPDMVDSRLAE